MKSKPGEGVLGKTFFACDRSRAKPGSRRNWRDFFGNTNERKETMPRGRKPVPPEILALKGAPPRTRRKLLLDCGVRNAAKSVTTEISVPAFLTPREQEIFRTAIAFARWTRPADYTALGRWCCYLRLWLQAKEKLGECLTYETRSKHGNLQRKSPQFAVLLDLERMMGGLEGRLGLDPVSRQAIARGLSAAAVIEPELDAEESSPIGWLLRKSH
jgi:phage terminase small subunit